MTVQRYIGYESRNKRVVIDDHGTCEICKTVGVTFDFDTCDDPFYPMLSVCLKCLQSMIMPEDKEESASGKNELLSDVEVPPGIEVASLRINQQTQSKIWPPCGRCGNIGILSCALCIDYKSFLPAILRAGA